MEEDRRLPFSLLVPTRKLLEHSLVTNPGWLEKANGAKKGTYPLAVLVDWHCLPEGVRLTLKPWLWAVQHRGFTLRLAGTVNLEEVYEAEREAASEVAAQDARRKAWEEFPSYKRWRLLNELEATPE